MRKLFGGVLPAVAALTLLAAGCTEVTLVPGLEGETCKRPSECAEGLTCVQGRCAVDTELPFTDVSGDEGGKGDVPPPEDVPDVSNDTTVDAEDVLEVTDPGTPEVIVTPDVPTDTPDVPDVDPIWDVADADAGEETAQTPDATEDVEIDVPPGPPGPDEPCEGDCPTGYLCLPQVDGVARCKPFPKGVCLPCASAADCPTPGAQCLSFPDGQSFCGAVCGTPADCPSGFSCTDGQCRPQTTSCECTPDLFGWSLPCDNAGAGGVCKGQTTCLQKGWSTCSAAAPSVELCNGKDDDCDGITDEEPKYFEKGKSLPFGAPCGLGVCAGGEVVCTPDGGVTCSGNALAGPEVCADQLDNDCDGQVNEGCESDDWDGDGVPNDKDCAPMDASTYPGATEKCCNPALGYNKACDTNCDGKVTPCASCDKDLDGFCPPEDCNDNDPKIHPGAAEKCNDGIDQDCQGGDLLCSAAQDKDGDGFIPPADCNEGNPSVYPYAEELCDNLDNDCDGLIDEGNPQGGQNCGTTAEYCQSGKMVCTHYGYGAVLQCQGAIKYGPETCDGVDNDCDGQTDETFTQLGQPCDGPDSDFCANGVLVCSGDGQGVECSDEAVSNLVEECNGLDDDCDGATDEFVCNLKDLDGDGYTAAQGDCDDWRPEVYPGAAEPCCDPKLGPAAYEICDLNCDGIIVPCGFNDADADGYPAGVDCDDNDPRTYPGAPEKCGDGKDQDCDGVDTNCALVQDKDKDGFHSGIDCNDNDNKVHPWATEVCNYIDDDCDGVIDNGNPSTLSGPCGPGTPGCDPGAWVCVHDAQTYSVKELCINDKFQATELCNGLDDDCDGEIDETFYDLGQPCDGPDADGCANGVFQCSEDGLGVTCGDEVVVDILEVCDGVDNDCNGQTDDGISWEGVALGQICDGTGVCGKGVVVCTAGFTVTCSTNPDGPFPQSKAETCNGLDDDCDGEIDEDFLFDGVPVGGACDGWGECGVGVVECNGAGGATCSTQPDGSAPQGSVEVCNGLDDDCDGLTDEELTLADSPCKAVGQCAAGGVGAMCADGEWVCDYTGVAGYEEDETLCDGLDNDCDGLTDEGWDVGLACDGDDTDLCQNGTWTCTPDGMGLECLNETEVDIEEVCNNYDDDCDGDVDEVEVSPAEAGCASKGVCASGEGVVVTCAEVGYACDYSGVQGWEADETLCDGLDNDCDGKTDEELLFEGAALGEDCDGWGECGIGKVQCGPGGSIICSTMPGGATPQDKPEVCNGLDEDCDGVADDDFLWNDLPVGAACDPSGPCGEGVVECAPSGMAALCSTGAGGSADQGQPETCNAVDDDCDGQTDETADLDLTVSGCPAFGVCAALDQFVSCTDGVWMCHMELLPDYEPDEQTCDDQDNDCDGLVDESFPDKGQLCDGPDPDQCPTGKLECNATGDGLVCGAETGKGSPETCDGIDNDCDGLIDEGFTYKGLPMGAYCDGVGACGLGRVECNGQGAATCSTNPDGSKSQVTAEVCNGKDDDCDGLTDEGLTWNDIPVGQPCDGVGACGMGVVVCHVSSGQATCSTNPNGTTPQSTTELCNGLDDDCDGQTDESFPEAGQPCDSAADADSCKTGEWTCQGGQMSCQGDYGCVPGSECYDPGAPAKQRCLCVGMQCTKAHGDSCDAFGCHCNGGLPCVAPKVCVPNVGCQ